MKKYLLIALTALSTTLFGQISGRMITHHVSTQSMVWSDVDQEYFYFPKAERYYEDNLIETTLNDDKSGKIVITNIATEDRYDFLIHDAIFDNQRGTITLQCIEVNTSTRCTIVVVADGPNRLVSVFMPTEKLVVHLDNLVLE